MESQSAVAALSALAHEARLSIYRLLVEAGPDGLVVGHIGEKLSLPGATLSFHLSQLQHAGLVTTRREGRHLIQVADFEKMNSLIGYLTENCCGGAVSCAPACAPAPVKAKRRKAANG